MLPKVGWDREIGDVKSLWTSVVEGNEPRIIYGTYDMD